MSAGHADWNTAEVITNVMRGLDRDTKLEFLAELIVSELVGMDAIHSAVQTLRSEGAFPATSIASESPIELH